MCLSLLFITKWFLISIFKLMILFFRPGFGLIRLYDRLDVPKWINFSGADYLSNNDEFSMIFLVRLHRLRLIHNHYSPKSWNCYYTLNMNYFYIFLYFVFHLFSNLHWLAFVWSNFCNKLKATARSWRNCRSSRQDQKEEQETIQANHQTLSTQVSQDVQSIQSRNLEEHLWGSSKKNTPWDGF